MSSQSEAGATAPGPSHARAETADVLTPARRVVLDVLGTSRGASTVADVAAATGLHLNTVREHLEALVDAGFASRGRLAPQGRGRPASTYEYAPQADMLSPGYGLMTSAMVDYVAATFGDSEELREHAYRAGRRWGEEIRERELLTGGGDVVEATVDLFADAGFAPSVHAEEDGRTAVRLLRCPVLTMARAYPHLVCRAHQGMADACLDMTAPSPEAADDTDRSADAEGADARPRHSRLEAFVDPGYCTYAIDVPAEESGLVLGDEELGPVGPREP